MHAYIHTHTHTYFYCFETEFTRFLLRMSAQPNQQLVPVSELAAFEVDINNELEVVYPDWSNRTEDKQVSIRQADGTFLPAAEHPVAVEAYKPIVYRYPRFDRLMLVDFDQDFLFPDWAALESNITCAAPEYSLVVFEEKFPAYIRCFGRVSGPRSEV
jgi:hypothetical protein